MKTLLDTVIDVEIKKVDEHSNEPVPNKV